MGLSAKPKSSRERTRAYRERLRAKGLKPVTLWLPDMNDPEVRAQIQRDCRLISESPEEREIMEWLDGVRYWPPDEPDMPDYGKDEPGKT